MRRPAALRFNAHVLYLCTRPEKVRAQLEGRRFGHVEALPIRDDISTEEISPLPTMVHFDAKLASYPYVGFKAGDVLPIGKDAIRDAGFEVVVAGKRYGKGSSREHSVVAERSAGVRLVIAESFERIYRQNADNLGLFTSTDFGLIERIERSEEIEIDELVAGRDALAAAILRHGGLLAYGRARMRTAAAGTSSQPPERQGADTDRPQTLFEKIVARHALATADTPARLAPGDGGFVRADFRYIHEYYTGMCAHMLEKAFGANLALHEPQSIVAFEDHMSYVHRSPAHVSQGLVGGVRGLSAAHRAFAARHHLAQHGYLQGHLDAGDAGNAGSEGISHSIMAEHYALPGQLIAGTDSHTPHSGAVGCVAFGVGTTDMANAFVTGAVRITMPEVLRVEFEGPLPPGVTAKDLVLHLLATASIRAGGGVGKVFEFGGSVVRALATDERTTLTNMTAELGGFTGIVEPDAETVRFLKERRGVDALIEPWMASDAGAPYCDVIRIDCRNLSPMVARPGDPGNGVALRDLPDRASVDIAYGGSCTAGKREDFDHYHAVLSWAAARGLRVPERVKLYLQFGSVDVRDYCTRRGYLPAFEAVGAELLQPACGACANCGPGSSTDASQITVSAINRNFPGRSGPGQVWLASPPTVAASAIAGELASFAELRARYGDAAETRVSETL
jgi:3-isopropylmalate/(R)-2-methylmalate dehydratase large subunit